MSTNKGKHKCPSCKKHLTRATILRDHQKSHDGDKPFSCSLCTRAFTRKHDKTMHERQVHERRKPYRCRHQDASGLLYGCDAGFERKRDLTRHLSRRAGDTCRTIIPTQDASPSSSMSIVIRHGGPDIDAETTDNDGMIAEEPYRPPVREMSSRGLKAVAQSQTTLAEITTHRAIQSFRPSTYRLHDWRLVVFNLSRASVVLAESLQCHTSSHHGQRLRSCDPLVLECHQDLNRSAQALIKHGDYGPLRLCVNALFVLTACQQDTDQLRIHTNIVDRLYDQYNKHPPPTGPSIGMWSFGGQHHLPLDDVELWRSGNLCTQSAIQRLRIDSGWFELESSWLSTVSG